MKFFLLNEIKSIHRRNYFFSFILIFSISSNVFSADTTLVLVKTIRGGLSPKSVVYNGKGLFFAQNMMYQHSISVFDHQYKLVSRISDQINPSEYGYDKINGEIKGAPVECAFTSDGKYAYVSNYCMEGDDYKKPGCDSCSGKDYDKSFIYKINTENFKIENILETGSVPKFLAITPNNQYLLVSNWSSADVSMIDLVSNTEVTNFNCGRFPRGIAIDSEGNSAYVAVMGGSHLMKIDLKNKSVEKFATVGRGPRHICIDPTDRYLYISINHEGTVVRLNLYNHQMDKLTVGGTPRSMTLSPDGRFLYVTNYSSNRITKIKCSDFSITESISTGTHPIGITFSEQSGEVWVACYSGSIMVYKDKESISSSGTELANLVPAFYDFYANAIRLIPESLKSEVAENKEITTNKEKKKEPSLDKTLEQSKVVEDNSSTGNYFVIVGSFKVIENANRQVTKLKKEGYTSRLITNSNGFHYAAIGGFENKEKATTQLSSVIAKNYPGAWIFEQQ